MIFYDRKVGERPTTILLLAIKIVDVASQILVLYRDLEGKCKGKCKNMLQQNRIVSSGQK
jgi:hypothetical protein